MNNRDISSNSILLYSNLSTFSPTIKQETKLNRGNKITTNIQYKYGEKFLLQTVTIFHRFKTKPNSTCKDSFKHDYINVLLPPPRPVSAFVNSPHGSAHTARTLNFPTGTGFSNTAFSLPHPSVGCLTSHLRLQTRPLPSPAWDHGNLQGHSHSK